MAKIAINKHHIGFEAVFTLTTPQPQVFHGVGKTKKVALQDLRNQLSKHMKTLDVSRSKMMWAIQEADMIVHTPSLLNGD